MRNKNHLNKEIRNIIEELLDKNYTFTDIAKTIYKDRRTISRDILKHRIKKYPGGFGDQVNYYCENNCNTRYRENVDYDCDKCDECCDKCDECCDKREECACKEESPIVEREDIWTSYKNTVAGKNCR